MAATAGKKALLKASLTNGSFIRVANLKSASFEIDGTMLDIGQLGDDWAKKIQSMKDGKGSASGQYDTSDTTGQVVLRSSLINDTQVFLQFLPDGVTGFQFEAKISKMAVTASTTTTADVSFDYEQTAGVTLI